MGKVEVIPGDLAQPQCGITADNQKRLLPEVQYVIHAAASIQFDNPIHTDLTLSYVATKAIADFAAKVQHSLIRSVCEMRMAICLWTLTCKMRFQTWVGVACRHAVCDLQYVLSAV